MNDCQVLWDIFNGECHEKINPDEIMKKWEYIPSE